MISFSLVTSTDVTSFCDSAPSGSLCQATVGGGGTGSGGLIMNNLNGEYHPTNNPNPVIDSELPGGGMLNILDISDIDLNDWTDFWITLENNGATAGNIEAKIYMNGSTTPADTFQLTLSGFNESAYEGEDDPYLELGISDNGDFGSIDVDFFSYKIGIHPPVTAPSESVGAIPEPNAGRALFVTGLLVVLGTRHRFVRTKP